MAGAANFDRLSSTLFVAALAHGVVILGVTFAPTPDTDESNMPALNVTLLVETETLDADARDAEILASRDQAGGGDDDAVRATRSISAAQPMNQQGDPLGVDTRSAEALAANVPVEQVVSRDPSSREVQAVPDTTDDPAPMTMTAAALLEQSAPDTLAAEIDRETANATNADSDTASPATMESALAAYIVSWRQRVERVGTANFPRELLATGSETRPVVEVTIDAAGRLRDANVVRSSGNTNLDLAALEILNLAGPFEPLPESILAETNVVQFKYEWYFSTGRRTNAGVR